MTLTRIPIALTIAGSDSGGGAGIQADLKTFAALGVHGASAITCLTAQNPVAITGIHACPAAFVRQQIEAVFAELPPVAVKTGMLFSTAIIQAVADFFRSSRRGAARLKSKMPLPAPPRPRSAGPVLIVDPVMISTSGVRLLQPSAIRAVRRDLVPLADLATPNLDEAEILLDRKINTPEQARTAARDLHARFGCAALVKGGHLRGLSEAVDFYYDGREELMLSAPFVKGVSTHGTGCAYAAAIAAYCARGYDMPAAVSLAKQFITEAIAQSLLAARHTVLNCFWHRDASSPDFVDFSG